MKARVLLPVNIRTSKPEILPDNNTGDRHYNEGDIIDIAEVVIGEDYKNNNFWYKLADGGFVWSGAISETGLPNRKIEYTTAISNITNEWIGNNGRGIKVAVLDTGFFLDHPDLKHLKSKAIIKDFGENGNIIDKKGHGTHILGLLAAQTSFKNGVVGMISEADFLLYKVIIDDVGFLDSIAELAVLDAIAQNADIINMSFNVPSQENSGLHVAIKKALDQDIIVVSSAGENDNLQKNLVYPAQFEGVTSVGELTAEFSHSLNLPFNNQLDFIMPFTEQTSCWISAEKLYQSLKGSSMASALITGVLTAIISSQGQQVNAINELIKAIPKFNTAIFDDNNLKIIKP